MALALDHLRHPENPHFHLYPQNESRAVFVLVVLL
jgi:hypothetical protein